MSADDQPAESGRLRLHISEEQKAGVWANFASVKHSPYEFTIDFARLDFGDDGKPIDGVVVQRVSLAPLFVSQLIDALQSNWAKYVEKALPPEARDQT